MPPSVTTYNSSPTTIGEGVSGAQATLRLSLHSIGGLLSVECPCPSGPLNAGHSWAADDAAKTGPQTCPPKHNARRGMTQITQIKFFRVAGPFCVNPDTSYSTTTTGLPSTSMRGVTPRPGCLEAFSRPLLRCGAPSAIDTLT